jgi:exopolyphosphatase/guanosine-5'-triphosphate,3'-diphosphate pyrophosphatase
VTGPVAAIDCGTNSTRLLIGAADGTTLERQMIITRLGEGVDRTGRLAPAAIERTLQVLRQYRAAMDASGVVAWLATATSAARDAGNVEEFLEPGAAILGGPIQVLAGEHEGRLSYGGATSALDPAGAPYLVVDVGGGSTELVTPKGTGQRSSPSGVLDIDVVSIDVGCVRVTERWLKSDPPTTLEMAVARAQVRDLLQAAGARRRFGRARTMVGLAGTVSALTVLDLGLVEYDRQAVHHARLRLGDVEQLIGRMAAVAITGRRQMQGMEQERADVLIGGALVLATIMGELGHSELVVSESDILDGAVAELLAGGRPPPAEGTTSPYSPRS